MGRILYIPKPVSQITTIKYGLLYNYYAANHADHITSSDDWIVPTLTNFNTLVTYLGGDTVAGGKLKEGGTTHWNTPNTSADNSSLFNGRGSGVRAGDTGQCSQTKANARFATSTIYNVSFYYYAVLAYNNAICYTIFANGLKFGNSIRLLRTSTELADRESGTYTGNDGKVYRTICIGTQEWLADNLAETKYRNSNDIPEITGNTDWTNDTTGALCAYENDWDNV